MRSDSQSATSRRATALFHLEFDLAIVAALLTILGYSVNDTVVVSDRIRENLRKYKKMELNELLNLSINETLSRTILTGSTTLVVLLALYIFGGEVIHNFTLAMLLGVIVGTYSSIFIAAPLLGYFGVKRDWSGAALPPRRRPTPENATGRSFPVHRDGCARSSNEDATSNRKDYKQH